MVRKRSTKPSVSGACVDASAWTRIAGAAGVVEAGAAGATCGPHHTGKERWRRQQINKDRSSARETAGQLRPGAQVFANLVRTRDLNLHKGTGQNRLALVRDDLSLGLCENYERGDQALQANPHRPSARLPAQLNRTRKRCGRVRKSIRAAHEVVEVWNVHPLRLFERVSRLENMGAMGEPFA